MGSNDRAEFYDICCVIHPVQRRRREEKQMNRIGKSKWRNDGNQKKNNRAMRE